MLKNYSTFIICMRYVIVLLILICVGLIAAGAGFEYTFVGINDSSADLGLLMEYHYDQRGADQSGFKNDLFAGTRLALNDVQSSELLAGIG